MRELVLLFVFVLSNSNAQKKLSMETIYEEKLDNITVKLLANNVTYGSVVENGMNTFKEINGAIGYVDWETVVTNKSGEEITLEKYHVDKTGIPWRMGELNGESLFPFYNIIKSFIRDNQLFIILFNGGMVSMDKYTFKEKKTFTKESKIITHFQASPAFGKPSGEVLIKDINGYTYFYLKVGTEMGKKSEEIYLLNAQTNSLKRIVFDPKITKVSDENELFLSLDLNLNVDKVVLEVKKVLIENKFLDKINNFKYLGNIDVTSFGKYQSRFMGGISYFFYQESILKTKIIRYNNDNKEWLIGNYTEEEIKQP